MKYKNECENCGLPKYSCDCDKKPSKTAVMASSLHEIKKVIQTDAQHVELSRRQNTGEFDGVMVELATEILKHLNDLRRRVADIEAKVMRQRDSDIGRRDDEFSEFGGARL